MPLLLTPETLHRLHASVDKLDRLRPPLNLEPKIYNVLLQSAEVGNYPLTLKDELQLADHFAFLAHADEGARCVSAVCIEQGAEGMIVRLASNETPLQATVEGLGLVCRAIENAVGSDHQTQASPDEGVLDAVINLSKTRIMQRIRPPWCRIAHRGGKEKPLWERLDPLIVSIPKSPGKHHEPSHLKENLQSLASNLNTSFTNKPADPALVHSIKRIIKFCFDITIVSPSKRSLRCQFSADPRLRDLGQRFKRDIEQVDKLCQYFTICHDIAKLYYRRKLRPLFRSITLHHLVAAPGTKPPGASRKCHVHAEVQLVLWYEQHQVCGPLPPRVIGGSKLACLLCDMFVQKHGSYMVSGSHQQFYAQWTIPADEARWATEQQALRYRQIVDGMIREMRGLVSGPVAVRKAALLRPFPLHSVARLPLSSVESSVLSLPALPPLLSLSQTQLPQPLDFADSLKLLDTGQGAVSASSPTVTELPTESLITSNQGTASVPSVDTKLIGSKSKRPRSESTPSLSSKSTILSDYTTTSFRLQEQNLPFHTQITLKTPCIHLQMGHIHLDIECVKFTSGQLSVTRGVPEAEEWTKSVSVHDIPTTEDMELPGFKEKQRFKFRIVCWEDVSVDIEVVRGKLSAIVDDDDDVKKDGHGKDGHGQARPETESQGSPLVKMLATTGRRR